MMGVTLADTHRAADLLWDNDPAEVVDSSDYACCFHYINSLAFLCKSIVCRLREIMRINEKLNRMAEMYVPALKYYK